MFSFDRLYELSKLHGVSKSHLCSLAGKNGSYISDLRRMQRTPPFDIINTWAEALHTTPAYLLGKTDQKEKPTTVSGSGHTKQAVDFAQENADLTSEEWLKLKEYALFLKAQRSTEDLK